MKKLLNPQEDQLRFILAVEDVMKTWAFPWKWGLVEALGSCKSRVRFPGSLRYQKGTIGEENGGILT